jgi:hypothetical protein
MVHGHEEATLALQVFAATNRDLAQWILEPARAEIDPSGEVENAWHRFRLPRLFQGTALIATATLRALFHREINGKFPPRL